MINFEITQSPDYNVISEFKYFQNQIYLGRTQGDLWIDDGELRTAHLMLEVIGNELLVHPQKEVDFYLVNGKRASTIKKLKPQDQVTIGETLITILGYEETIKENKKAILGQNLAKLIAENSPRLYLIESLTKRMK
jgi:hypothetical protein